MRLKTLLCHSICKILTKASLDFALRKQLSHSTNLAFSRKSYNATVYECVLACFANVTAYKKKLPKCNFFFVKNVQETLF